MNGQGPNAQLGGGAPRQPRPKFNFNNRNVKKEITPDFMAAQLASFGSSAKLKSLPDQQQQLQQQSQQQQPQMPYQMNQGFRQPMGFIPPMNPAGQQQFFPQANMQPAMGMQVGLYNQFNMRPNAMQPNMAQPNMMQPNMAMTQNRFPPMSMMGTVSASSSQSSFVTSSVNQPTATGGGMFDMFGTSQPTAQAPDPFANLRNSNQLKGTTPQPVLPTANQPSVDVFGSKPFVPTSAPSSQFNNLSSNFNMQSSTIQQSTLPVSSSAPLSTFPASGFSDSVKTGTPQNDPFSTINDRPRGQTAFVAQSPQVDLFSSSTMKPHSQTTIDVFASSKSTPSSSADIFPQANPPSFDPFANSASNNAPDLFAQTKPQSQPPFANSNSLSNADLFTQAKPSPGQSSFDPFSNSNTSAGLLTKPAAQTTMDIFASSKPISNTPSDFLAQPARSHSPSTTAQDPFSNSKPISNPSPDLFAQLKSESVSSSPDPFVSLKSTPSVKPQGVSSSAAEDPFSGSALGSTDLFNPPQLPPRPPAETKSEDDKYSVFTELEGPAAAGFAGLNTAPPAVKTSIAVESPLSFPASSMFDDAFDPFSEKTTDTSSSAEKRSSITEKTKEQGTARSRPATKTPATMILLPPPTKPVEKKQQPGPSQVQFDPFSNSGAPSSTSTPAASESAKFDPFSVEPDGAAFAKPAKQNPPPRPGPTKKPPPRPAAARTKRPAPPPPVRKGPSGAPAVISLLDLDFSDPGPALPPGPGEPAPQPLLILPSQDFKAGKPAPARPPPPKTEDSAAAPAVMSMPPPLPPRPGPGHPLHHYIIASGPHAVALFDFQAENSDELDFKAGDKIQLVEEVSVEWFSGKMGTKIGIFPKNMVDVKIPIPYISKGSAGLSPGTPVLEWQSPAAVEKDPFNAWEDSGVPSPPSPPASPVPPEPSEPASGPTYTSSVFDTPLTSSVFDAAPSASAEEPSAAEASAETVLDTCVALYDFQAQEDDELDIKEGDTVEIIEILEGDWLRGRVGERSGIFPKSYVSMGDEEYTEESLEDILDDATHSVNVYYDFVSDMPDELNLQAGDMVQVTAVVGKEWLRGRCKDKEGIFPVCFVPAIPSHWNIPTDTTTDSFETTEEGSDTSVETTDALSVVSEATSNEDVSDLGTAKVIADFEAENDWELSLKAGDVVRVTAKLNELWLEGEVHGATGVFPSNFVKWIEEEGFLSNPLISEDLPALTHQETLTAMLTRQDTLQDTAAGDSVPGFSTSNPFAAEPTAAQQEGGEIDLDRTITSPENPFTSAGDQGESPFAHTTESPFAPTAESPFAPTAESPFAPTAESPFAPTAESPFAPTAESPFTESPFTAAADSPFSVPKPGDKMVALYAFTPDNDDELAFEEGDKITVLEFLNEEWLKGSCNGNEGLFPTSFAKILLS